MAKAKAISSPVATGWSYANVPPAQYAAYTPPQATPIAQALADGGGGDQTRPPFDFSTDPGYLAALAAEQAGSAQLDASMRAAREQAVVRFGDPGLAAAFGIGDLSPLTAAMAQQATTSGISTLGQLNRQRDLNQQTLQNQLAAHGIIRSGDLGWRTGQNQQNYAVDLYNAQQDVLDTLASAAASNVSGKQTLHTNTVNALTKAYETYINDPKYYGMGSPAPDTSQLPAVTPTTGSQAAAPRKTAVTQALTSPQATGYSYAQT